MIYDYTENHVLPKNKIKWLDVTLNLKNYALHIRS